MYNFQYYSKFGSDFRYNSLLDQPGKKSTIHSEEIVRIRSLRLKARTFYFSRHETDDRKKQKKRKKEKDRWRVELF